MSSPSCSESAGDERDLLHPVYRCAVELAGCSGNLFLLLRLTVDSDEWSDAGVFEEFRKQGVKRSLLTEAKGIPLSVVADGALRRCLTGYGSECRTHDRVRGDETIVIRATVKARSTCAGVGIGGRGVELDHTPQGVFLVPICPIERRCLRSLNRISERAGQVDSIEILFPENRSLRLWHQDRSTSGPSGSSQPDS